MGLCENSSNNAWIYNGTNGNLNNNNKNNSNSVRPITEFINNVNMVSIEDVFNAYYACRKNKRTTESALDFEVDYEENCIKLWKEINARTYETSKSIAFIVKKPRIREIFAANFRDRIVHHLIDIKIRPLLELDLIPKTCNNRVGKGTFRCVAYLKEDILKESNNLTEDCYVCKMDMKNFFMSIRKDLLTDKILDYVSANYFENDREDLKWLINLIVNDNPELNCVLKSPLKSWKKLDKTKSLFYVGDDKGLPIGNLISQILANFYLNDFDHFVSEELGFDSYGRYVDDFYIVSKSKKKILKAIQLIREKLSEIGIELHKNKFYIQHYSKGIDFVGTTIKKDRLYVSNRTKYNAFVAIEKVNKLQVNSENIDKAIPIINSYLGFMKHKNSYAIRRCLLDKLSEDWWSVIYVRPGFNKVTLRRKYKARNEVKRRIVETSNKNIKRSNGKSRYYKQKARRNN